MRVIVIIAFLLPYISGFSQSDTTSAAGTLSFGVRSSWGLVYEGDWQRMAFGSGAQFRLQFSDKVNSDWFLDYLHGDLEDYGKRTDIHIGWSVLYYPLNKKGFVQPYILAGHCFEFLTISENMNAVNKVQRTSASIQAGAGMHFHLSPRFDLSLETQYMMHFGPDIETVSLLPVEFVKEEGLALQDHLLFHFSINYSVADLW
ncbi:MAG: hypothetical protein C0592_00700 [Marinilabiliales bacterium]|nr:MAG: hypothetical protein C0592_00700 [Marinilabiliales bacterium]